MGVTVSLAEWGAGEEGGLWRPEEMTAGLSPTAVCVGTLLSTLSGGCELEWDGA